MTAPEKRGGVFILTHCPVCRGRLEVTKLHCHNCDTKIEGHFSGCGFCDLREEERLFLEVFITSRGSIKEVEKKLGISYPTVRSKLDSIIEHLENSGRTRELFKQDVNVSDPENYKTGEIHIPVEATAV